MENSCTVDLINRHYLRQSRVFRANRLIFLSIQAQINTFIYPTIKFSLFAAPKSQKIRGPGFTSKSSEKPYISSIFTLFILYLSQHYYALHMARNTTMDVIRMRKHIHRLPVIGNISSLLIRIIRAVIVIDIINFN